ncbi:hypothetical protein OH76DRAFT_1489686 [Lentinus brumalis]|uniref:Uncharacterized protein n=1 Tax=Lentinus brumalis TaxID=2498619 RepID=A0A371CLN9_9APHY|nr:hypothetical protein OH76DRAFT_1489686 [Polyporus brumalis]
MPPGSSFVAPTVNYAPDAVVAAKPILPVQRKAVVASGGDNTKKQARTKEKNEAVEKALMTWYDDAQGLANRLSEEHGNKPEYYLRLMFTGGQSLQKSRGPNAYNAWTHNLAKEYNQDADGGETMNLVDLQREHADEYQSLSAAEKAELVRAFKDTRESRSMGLRVNPRGRKQDANSVFDKIETMIIGLKCRVGLDGFYCFFKNNSEYQMRPRWFFTSPQLNRYLSQTVKRWDVETIGGLGEAFSIAGCDLMTYLRTAKARSDWLKAEIRDKIAAMLAKITGNKNIVMQYKAYEKDIVIENGVELVGWTHDVFACPSSLPPALEPLQKLLQAIDDGQCHFKRLTASEVTARRKEFERKVAEGTVPARKERADKGQKRGKYRARKTVAPQEEEEQDDEGEGDGSKGRAQKRRRTDDETG